MDSEGQKILISLNPHPNPKQYAKVAGSPYSQILLTQIQTWLLIHFLLIAMYIFDSPQVVFQ